MQNFHRTKCPLFGLSERAPADSKFLQSCEADLLLNKGTLELDVCPTLLNLAMEQNYAIDYADANVHAGSRLC